MKSTALLVFVSSTFLIGCIDVDEKGPEEDAPSAAAKDDSLRSPIVHGAIGFDDPRIEAITAEAGHHAWTFELSGAADVQVSTGPAVRHQKPTDTVVYLYRQRPDGSWGSYVARNDDARGTLWSWLDRSLEAGSYRVTVKGYDRQVRGKFALTVRCEGEGCAAPAPTCVLGDTYWQLAEQPGLQLRGRQKVTAATEWLDELTRQRIVLAVQQSSHTDVTTAAEAFARVDEGEINITWIREPAARRDFVAFEYGAGDNSYGAIFGIGTTIVASIHDGDLLGCETPPQVCRLPATYADLLADAAFTTGATRVVTAAGQVSGVEADQVLAALRSVYGAEVTSLAQGLSLPDGQKVNVTPLTHRATGTELVAVELRAGDASVGLVFFAGRLDVAATINDLALETCTFFE
jgi:hypothetical protein